MNTMTTTHTLKITHGTSRARDTYGYPTVTLTDQHGRKFKCMGGGYDLFGTVLAEWLTAAYPERTAELADAAYYTSVPGEGTRVNEDGLYGVHHSGGRVWLDGAVGQLTIERLAKDHYGLTVKATLDSRGHTTGWTVTEG